MLIRTEKKDNSEDEEQNEQVLRGNKYIKDDGTIRKEEDNDDSGNKSKSRRVLVE